MRHRQKGNFNKVFFFYQDFKRTNRIASTQFLFNHEINSNKLNHSNIRSLGRTRRVFLKYKNQTTLYKIKIQPAAVVRKAPALTL